MDIPSSVTVVGQHWGRHMGIMHPGSMCCVCYSTRMAYIVTKNTIRYDAPVIDCPTKDNVKIRVDINLTFKIMDDEANIKKFIYSLGAARLDTMLQVEIDEAIRNFIHTIKHNQVLDLKSEMATHMIEELNGKFKLFGVHFENATVTSIKVPHEIEEAFSATTLYNIKMQSQAKNNENDVLLLENEENQTLTEMKKDNYAKLQETNAAKERAKLEREEKVINAQTLTDVECSESERKASALKTQVGALKTVAENTAKRQIISQINQVQVEADSQKIKMDSLLKAKANEAEAIVESSKSKAKGLLAEAEAEKNSSNDLKVKRLYEFSMARTEVIESK
jgi:regulator of protease activity HflC (stomatin/prohibitin superfamily)